ncbi:MAG: hypothetical protein ACPG32_00395 [Akkermansiaceae bacterium]
MRNTFSLSRSITAVVVAPALALSLSMCEKEATDQSPETSSETPAKSALQLAAEKTIAEHPDVELVEVMGEKIHLRNVHTNIGLILPFQDIIDGKFDRIKGDAGKVGNILKPRETGKVTADKPHEPGDWGKVPTWIPRYPDLVIEPNAMHSPRNDGSIWGLTIGNHTDEPAAIRAFYVKELAAQGLELRSDGKRGDALSLVFQTSKPKDKTAKANRFTSILLEPYGGRTRVTIQYQYDM